MADGTITLTINNFRSVLSGSQMTSSGANPDVAVAITQTDSRLSANPGGGFSISGGRGNGGNPFSLKFTVAAPAGTAKNPYTIAGLTVVQTSTGNGAPTTCTWDNVSGGRDGDSFTVKDTDVVSVANGSVSFEIYVMVETSATSLTAQTGDFGVIDPQIVNKT